MISGKSVGWVTACLVFCLVATLFAQDGRLWVGQFSQTGTDQWQPKILKGTTLYSINDLDGRSALKAVSDNSASGLIREMRIDLEQTPFLNWSWRIENRIQGEFDETLKSGDDYAARVYVVVSGGFAFWKTLAVNYVWARHAVKGKVWPNAYAGKNAMITALRSSEAPVATWISEKRNVAEDFNQLFGQKVRYIDAVVIMSDTDNTHTKVTAHYGDLYFSKK